MGLFDRIKGAVGVGQPSLEVILERPSVGLGGLVCGVVRATGGERPVPITAIEFRLKRGSEQHGMSVATQDRAPLDGQPLSPGQTLVIPFALQVPSSGMPSQAGVDYKVEVALDVPGLDPNASTRLIVDAAPDPLAAEDFAQYHLLAEPHSFRHSSVRGDFRLVAARDGFLIQWKTHTSIRGRDGAERARIEGFGRVATQAPDGRIAAADAHKRIGFFDPATGAPVGDPIEVGDYVNDIVFVGDGSRAVLNTTHQLLVCDPSGRVGAAIADLGIGELFIASIAPGPGSVVYAVDANQSKLIALDLDRGVLGAVDVRYPRNVYPSADGSLLVIDSSESIYVFDARAQLRAQYRIPGKKGIRHAGQAEHSYTHFKGNARLSPDNRSLLVQDGSGQLFLLDALSGEPRRRYDRATLDYVEDTLWIDPAHFVAITNDGGVHGVAIDGTKVFTARPH